MKLLHLLFSVLLMACTSENVSTDTVIDEDPILVVSDLIEGDITNDSLYVERAKINIERKRFTEALRDLERANLLDSTKGETHYLLGDVLLELAKQGDGSKKTLVLASNHFFTAVDRDFNTALSYKKGGEILLYFAEYIKSIDLLTRSVSINPNDFHTYILLGYSYRGSDEIESSIASFKKSISIKSENEEAYLQLGNLYFANQDSAAIQYYKTAIDINPSSRDAYYNLGLLYHTLLMYSESQDAYHKIVDLEIEDGIYEKAIYNLGFMFQEDLKDYRNAINYFIELTRVNSNHYMAYFRMGICYEGLGDVRNAEQYYRKTLDINPEFKEATEKLNKLLSDNEKYK